MVKLEYRAMGCEMLALLDTTDEKAHAALARVPDWFEKWEQSLSRFRPDSELCALNRQAGTPVRVSETLWQVALLALKGARLSKGIVTPTILEALEAAGYTHSMADPKGVGVEDLPRLARRAARVQDWHAVKLNARRKSILLPPGVCLDLAGVAKGWAAQTAARRLAATAPALVDAGGDIFVSGPHADGTPWAIGIENPFGKDEELPLLALRSGAVVTSTRGYRRWQRQDGAWQHHLIDPRTGAPSMGNVFSVTVIAPTAALGEVAAKTAFILGGRKGLEWINARPNLAALLIQEDGKVECSRRLESFIWK